MWTQWQQASPVVSLDTSCILYHSDLLRRSLPSTFKINSVGRLLELKNYYKWFIKNVCIKILPHILVMGHEDIVTLLYPIKYVKLSLRNCICNAYTCFWALSANKWIMIMETETDALRKFSCSTMMRLIVRENSVAVMLVLTHFKIMY